MTEFEKKLYLKRAQAQLGNGTNGQGTAPCPPGQDRLRACNLTGRESPFFCDVYCSIGKHRNKGNHGHRRQMRHHRGADQTIDLHSLHFIPFALISPAHIHLINPSPPLHCSFASLSLAILGLQIVPLSYLPFFLFQITIHNAPLRMERPILRGPARS